MDKIISELQELGLKELQKAIPWNNTDSLIKNLREEFNSKSNLFGCDYCRAEVKKAKLPRKLKKRFKKERKFVLEVSFFIPIENGIKIHIEL